MGVSHGAGSCFAGSRPLQKVPGSVGPVDNVPSEAALHVEAPKPGARRLWRVGAQQRRLPLRLVPVGRRRLPRGPAGRKQLQALGAPLQQAQQEEWQQQCGHQQQVGIKGEAKKKKVNPKP